MYALYASELTVVVLLALVYAVQLGVNSWLLTKGTGESRSLSRSR